PAAPWRSSARAARGKRRRSNPPWASTPPPRGTSSSTGGTFATSRWPRCGARPARGRKTPSSSPAPSRATSAWGGRGAAPAEVMEAARAAGLEEFVAGLPERYETVIGERGANLSGGQRQRLAIARALLRRPQVLIFDEATSHLDTATERAIQESLKRA